MCVILCSPGVHARPSLSDLRQCQRANPDGTGLAWVDQAAGRVRYVKGLTLSVAEVHQRLLRLQGPAVVHFRIKTVGPVCDELCHPFPVARSGANPVVGRFVSVLFHNGTWDGWPEAVMETCERYDAPLPEGSMSDSRAAAWILSHEGADAMKRLKMTGKYAHLAVGALTRYGDWTERLGVHYSNMHWCRDWSWGTTVGKSKVVDAYPDGRWSRKRRCRRGASTPTTYDVERGLFLPDLPAPPHTPEDPHRPGEGAP